VPATIRFDDNPGADGNYAEITAAKVSADIPLIAFDGFKNVFLALNASVSSAKQFLFGFDGTGKLNAEAVTFSARAPPLDPKTGLKFALTLKETLKAPVLSGGDVKNLQAFKEFEFKNIVLRDHGATAVTTLFSADTPVEVFKAPSMENYAFALLPGAFSWDSIIPGIKRIPLHAARVTDTAMIMVPLATMKFDNSKNRNEYTHVNDLPAVIRERIEQVPNSKEEVNGKTDWVNLTDGLNLFTKVDVASSKHMKALFDLVGVKERHIGLKGRISPNVFWVMPEKVGAQLKEDKKVHQEIIKTMEIVTTLPGIKIAKLDQVFEVDEGTFTFKGQPVFDRMNAGTDTGDVEVAAILSSPSRFTIPSPLKGAPPLKVFKLQTNIHKGIEDRSFEIKVEGVTGIDWKQAFGIPFFNLNKLGVDFTLNQAKNEEDEKTKKTKVGALTLVGGVSAEVQVGDAEIKTVGQLVFEDGKFHDLVFQAPNAVQLAKLPGLGHVPFINELEVENMSLSLAGAFTGMTVKWPRMGIHGQAGVMTLEKTTVLMVRGSAIELKKIAPVPDVFNIKFPQALFAISAQPGGKGDLGKFELTNLPDAARQMLAGIIDNPGDEVPIRDGLNLLGAVTKEVIPKALRDPLNEKFAIFDAVDGPLILAGVIDGLLVGKPKIGLYAQLPGFKFPKGQPWERVISFDRVGTSFFLDLNVATTIFRAGVQGNSEVSIPHLNDPRRVDKLKFAGEAYMNLDLVTFVPAIKFAGYMDGEWRKPMGINDNFTMINPAFLIGADTDGSVEFGVGASANWKVRGGKKDLRFDVDFVTNINFSSSIPLPKKLGLVYKASELSLLTRFEIEEAMLRGVLTGPMADVAMEALIDPNAKKAARDLQEQLRKTSLIDIMQLDKPPIPNVVFKNVNLFFATPGAVIPGREDTLDTIGLRAGGEMSIDMLGQTHRLGAVDYRLTLTDGIIIKADIEPRKLGPLKLKNAKIDVQANIKSLPHFKIRGDVDLLGLTETLDINLSKDKIGFFYNKDLGPLLKLAVNARTEGEDLFRAKDFVVEASVEQGLHDLLLETVNSNMPVPPLVRDIINTTNSMTPLRITGAKFRGALVEFIKGRPLTLELDHRIFGEKMEPAVATVKPIWNVSSPLEAFPTVPVTLALGNSFLNYLERHPVDVSKVIPAVGPLTLQEASLRVERNTARGHAREFVIRGRSELLGATRDTALRFYNTGMVLEEEIAVAQLWNSSLYGEVLAPKLGKIDDIRYNGEFKADFYSWLKKSVGGALDSHFKKVGSGLDVAQKKLDEAKNWASEVDVHIGRARQHAINERERILRPLRDAEAAVRRASDDVDYARRRARAEEDWIDDNCCGWGTNWFKVGAHKAAEAFWWATYGVAKAALWTAEKFLEGLRRTIEIIPIDLHPVVVFWKGVKVTALGALEIAKGAVSFAQAVNTTVADAVNKLINVVAGAKILVVNKAIYWGTMKSGDLNVDLNFDLFNWRNLELNGLRVNLKDPTRTNLTGLAMAALKIVKKEDKLLQEASRLPALAPRMVQPSNLVFTEAAVLAVKDNEQKALAAIQQLRQQQAEADIAVLERKSALTPEEIAERIRRIDALAKLEVPKKYYHPGEEIVARLAASKTYEKNAWVGMMPANVSRGDVKVNTNARTAYENLNKRTGGTIKFKAPREYGEYSIRLNTGEVRGREVRTVDFVVERVPVAQALKLSIPPGGIIDARFVAPKRYPHDAWFGIVPANIPHGREAANDANNKGFVYTETRVEDVVQFTVPKELGAYDLRLNDNDNNGKETASAPFRVELQPKVLLKKIGFVTGEGIKVGYEAPWSYPTDAWIGLVPSDVAHGKETANDARDVARANMNSQSRGDFVLTAPEAPGKYDVRMHTNDNGGDEVYSLTVSVEEVAIAIKKTEFIPGEDIEIAFKSPSFYPGTAWIGIYPADAPRNELGQKDPRILSYDLTRLKTTGTLTFPAPAEAGHYEVRFNDDGGNGEDGNPKGNEGKGGREVRVLKFVVEPAAVSSVKQDFIPGEPMSVDYVVPSWYPATSWVALVPSNAPKQTRGVNEPVNKEHHALPITGDERARRTAENDPNKRARRGRLTFTAPEPGLYDLRLNDDGGNGEDGTFKGFAGKAGGKDVRLATFTVEPATVLPKKNDYIPGELIVVSADVPSFYSSYAFLSLVKADAGNVGGHQDKAIVEMHALPATAAEQTRARNETDPLKKYRKKQLTFTAPEAGLYELRFSDDGGNGVDGLFKGFGGKTGGKDVRLATIRVEPVSVTPRKNDFIPREPIKVAFEAPSWYSDASFISLVKTGDKLSGGHADAKIMQRHDLKRTTTDIAKAKNDHPLRKYRTGEVVFTAPEPGTYDLLFDDDGGNGDDGKFTGFGGQAGGKTVRLATLRVEPATITPKKLEFIPRETISMKLEVPSFYSDDAIVGLVKATDGVVKGQGDAALIQFAKLGATDGEKTRAQTETDPLKKFRVKEITFPAPEPGTYHLRFNDDGGNGEDGKFKGFGGKTGGQDVRFAEIKIEPVLVKPTKDKYIPRERIKVAWNAPSWYSADSWITLVKEDAKPATAGHTEPSIIEMHKMRITPKDAELRRTEPDPLKRYRKDEFVFTAPDPGVYHLRLNDDGGNGEDGAFKGFAGKGDGKEVRFASFTIEPASVTTPKDKFIPGETIDISYVVPHWYSDQSFVSLVKADPRAKRPAPTLKEHQKLTQGRTEEAEAKLRNDVKGQKNARIIQFAAMKATAADKGRAEKETDPLKRFRKGSMTFTAPEPGTYELRLNDDGGNGEDGTFKGYGGKTPDKDGKVGGKGVRLALITVEPVSVASDRTGYVPDEPIQVTWQAPSWYGDFIWASLVKADAPHETLGWNQEGLIQRQRLRRTPDDRSRAEREFDPMKRFRSGTFTFVTPKEPGTYQVRINDDGGNGKDGTFTGFQGKGGGKEIRVTEFTVEEVGLTLAKQSVQPGDTLDLAFKAPSFYDKTAWLAIVEASVPNGDEGRNFRRRVRPDEGLLVRTGNSRSTRSHYTLDGKTEGSLNLNTPEEIGAYEIRLHDARDGGREVLVAEFFVDPAPAIAPAKPQFFVGETISLTFQASKGFKNHAWIGIVPADTAHGNETINQRARLSRKNLNRRDKGSMTLSSILQPGRYDIRMFDSNDNGNEVASVTIEVVPRQTN